MFLFDRPGRILLSSENGIPESVPRFVYVQVQSQREVANIWARLKDVTSRCVRASAIVRYCLRMI